MSRERVRKIKAKITGLDHKYELIFLILAVTVVLFCLLPVIANGGWPNNPDEGLKAIFRVQAYADHVRHWDMFPVWSSADIYGYGSPTLLYYHKTFYYFASFVLIIFGSMKFALLLTLAFFMMIAIYGMRFCARQLTDDKFVITASSIVIVLTSYSFTNWLYRGAFSEFTAMMILPWLFWWCHGLIKSNKFSYWIIPIGLALAFGHNVIAMFAVLLVFVALIIYRIVYGSYVAIIKKLIIAVTILLVLISPYLLLLGLFKADYNPSKITQNGFKASQNFAPFARNVLPHRCGFTGVNLPDISLNYGTSILLLVGAALSIKGFIRSKNRNKPIEYIEKQPILAFLLVNFLILSLLQLSISRPIYHLIPILEYLQFPWRLMTLMVPVSILLVVIMLGRINKNNDRLVKVTFIIWLLSLLILSPVFNVHGFGRVTDKQLDSVKSLSGSDNFGIQLTGYGEFLPRVYKNNVEINSLSTYKQYKAFLVEGQQLNNVCHIRSTHKQSVDSTTIKYSITCSEDSEIKLPISYSRYTKVINADTGHAIKYFRYPDDPRGVIKLNKTDGQNIIIELPTAVLIIRQLM